MPKSRPVPEVADRIVIDDALESASTQLYHLQHQLQLAADLASVAPPRLQCSAVLAESIAVSLGVYAATAGALSAQLDQLAIYCRAQKEASPCTI